jgi:hypothetical protein
MTLSSEQSESFPLTLFALVQRLGWSFSGDEGFHQSESRLAADLFIGG